MSFNEEVGVEIGDCVEDDVSVAIGFPLKKLTGNVTQLFIDGLTDDEAVGDGGGDVLKFWF